MRSSLLASVDVIEFHTTEAYSNLGLTEVKYKTYKLSREKSLSYRANKAQKLNTFRKYIIDMIIIILFTYDEGILILRYYVFNIHYNVVLTLSLLPINLSSAHVANRLL
jgi:hypothetical protein